MTTIKELSAQLNITPQTVRNFVKEELGVQSVQRKTLQLDATQASIVADHFKNKKSGFAKNNANTLQNTLQDFAKLKEDFAGLSERVAGLERENELLRERIAVADKALEREQMQARGFWSKLGQKLLGE